MLAADSANTEVDAPEWAGAKRGKSPVTHRQIALIRDLCRP